MRKPLLIVLAALMLAAMVFAGAYYGVRHLCVEGMAQSTDDLDWLRVEFHLTDAELAKIRVLHEGYLPICETNCIQIAARQRALKQAVAAGTNSPATLDQLRDEVATFRSKCQSEMIAHFEEVSLAMPPGQGQRYLAEMKRITLGSHEQVEASMSGTNGHGHDHH